MMKPHAPAHAGTPRWRSFPPFYEHLGLKLEALAEGESAIRMPFQAQFGNPRGEVHGGLVAALLDIGLSQAVRSQMDDRATVATISMTVNYLAPAFGELVCRGRIVRYGRSIAFAEGEVSDEQGKAVCRASATYKLIHPRA